MRRRLSRRAETITKEDIKAAVNASPDEALSIRSLIARHEAAVIITDPREYQLELFERAKEENIIAVLDTGWYLQLVDGKTLTANQVLGRPSSPCCYLGTSLTKNLNAERLGTSRVLPFSS